MTISLKKWFKGKSPQMWYLPEEVDLLRFHAGNLCHRLWSDGTIDSYYPWKIEKRNFTVP